MGSKMSSSSSAEKLDILYVKDIPKDKLHNCIWRSTYDLIFRFSTDTSLSSVRGITKSSYEWFSSIVNTLEFERTICDEGTAGLNMHRCCYGTDEQQMALCKSFIRHIERVPVNLLCEALLKSLQYATHTELSELINSIEPVNK